jgi:hypothetical protein
MKREARAARASRCLATMELDRVALRSIVSGGGASSFAGAKEGFPRSLTFRWVASHVNVQSLAKAAASMLLASFPIGRIFRGW